VLFLNDAENGKIFWSKFFNRCVPHGHNLSTTSSPTGEMHQQDFFAAIVRELNGTTIFYRRQDEVRVWLPNLWRVAGALSLRLVHREQGNDDGDDRRRVGSSSSSHFLSLLKISLITTQINQVDNRMYEIWLNEVLKRELLDK
jgi:hypothetical protein